MVWCVCLCVWCVMCVCVWTITAWWTPAICPNSTMILIKNQSTKSAQFIRSWIENRPTSSIVRYDNWCWWAFHAPVLLYVKGHCPNQRGFFLDRKQDKTNEILLNYYSSCCASGTMSIFVSVSSMSIFNELTVYYGLKRKRKSSNYILIF